MKNKADFQKKFIEVYPKGCRLLAVQLDGFSHAVVFDKGKGSEISFDRFSECMPEGNWSSNAMRFFKGIGHAQFQNNAQELIFVLPKKR